MTATSMSSEKIYIDQETSFSFSLSFYQGNFYEIDCTYLGNDLFFDVVAFYLIVKVELHYQSTLNPSQKHLDFFAV
jgi:hypothetical protein